MDEKPVNLLLNTSTQSEDDNNGESRSRSIVHSKNALATQSGNMVKKDEELRQQGCLMELPPELQRDIISRLPTSMIMECREVCIPLLSMTRDNSFAHMLLTRQALIHGNSVPYPFSPAGLLFTFKTNQGFDLYYGEFCGKLSKLLKFNQPAMSYPFVDSCNGLVLVYKIDLSKGVEYEPKYVSNPITCEYLNIPIIEGKGKVESVAFGFGQDQLTCKYKVVRIHYVQAQPLGEVQVYTLGDGSWKNLGQTNLSLRFPKASWRGDTCRGSPLGRFFNGSLHWLNRDLSIVVFNLHTEEFEIVSSPPYIHNPQLTNRYQLGVLGGCLTFVHQQLGWIDKSIRGILEIWIRTKGDGNQDTWQKKLSIRMAAGEANPLAIIKSGEVLLTYQSDLYCYDPVTAARKKVRSSDFICAVPHTHSFVSLAALGTTCRRRKRVEVEPSGKAKKLQRQQ